MKQFNCPLETWKFLDFHSQKSLTKFTYLFVPLLFGEILPIKKRLLATTTLQFI
jgi:hypothetical protein